MTWGVTPTGFSRKTLQDVLDSLRAAQHAAPELGPTLDVSDLSAVGQLNGTHAAEIAELWELAEEVYHSADPEAALNYSLTALASITGTQRRGATASQVLLMLTLEAGASVPAGSLVSQEGLPSVLFATDAAVVNSDVIPVNVSVTATCTQLGPIAAAAGTLTTIVTSASGWAAVVNPTDAEQGRVADNDVTLRQRRVDQLKLRGGSTVGAIQADLLDSEGHPELAGIEDVIVLENTGDTTDLEGLPPHSFEAIIDDGAVPTVADDDIAQAIFETKPAGIHANGSSSGIATSATGQTFSVGFSRATRRNVYVVMTLTTDSTFPVDGPAQVKAKVVEYGTSLGVGDDVIALAARARAFQIIGVLDVPTFTIGFAPAPVGTANLPCGTRERADFDTSRITVT